MSFTFVQRPINVANIHCLHFIIMVALLARRVAQDECLWGFECSELGAKHTCAAATQIVEQAVQVEQAVVRVVVQAIEGARHQGKTVEVNLTNPLRCTGCQAQSLPGSLCLRWGDVKSKDQDDMTPANGDDDTTRCKSDGDDATTICKSDGDDATTRCKSDGDAKAASRPKFRTHLVCRLPGSNLAW